MRGIGIGLPVGMFPPSGIPLITLPLDIASLIGWFDASDLTTLFQDSAGTTPVAANSDPVAKWNDKSGVGNHVTQPGAAGLKPTYTTGVQNSLPGISFDGGDYLDIVATYPSFPITVIGVGRTSGTVGTTRGLFTVYHSTNFGSRVTFVSTNVLTARIETPNTTRSGATYGANTTFLFGARFSSSLAAVISNGVISEAAHTASAVTNIFSIGRGSVNAATNLWNGYVCEFSIYNAALTDVQIGQLVTYLNTKWGVY